MNIVYYKGKQVLCVYIMIHVTVDPSCEERRRTREYIYIYTEVMYTDIYIYI